MTSLSWRSLFNYLVRIGDCLSQLLNVAVFLGQNPNESVSGRAFRLRRISTFWKIAYKSINFLFYWQDDHCQAVYIADLKRAEQTLHNR